jgi:hypothetical protein
VRRAAPNEEISFGTNQNLRFLLSNLKRGRVVGTP